MGSIGEDLDEIIFQETGILESKSDIISSLNRQRLTIVEFVFRHGNG